MTKIKVFAFRAILAATLAVVVRASLAVAESPVHGVEDALRNTEILKLDKDWAKRAADKVFGPEKPEETERRRSRDGWPPLWFKLSLWRDAEAFRVFGEVRRLLIRWGVPSDILYTSGGHMVLTYRIQKLKPGRLFRSDKLVGCTVNFLTLDNRILDVDYYGDHDICDAMTPLPFREFPAPTEQDKKQPSTNL